MFFYKRVFFSVVVLTEGFSVIKTVQGNFVKENQILCKQMKNNVYQEYPVPKPVVDWKHKNMHFGKQ